MTGNRSLYEQRYNGTFVCAYYFELCDVYFLTSVYDVKVKALKKKKKKTHTHTHITNILCTSLNINCQDSALSGSRMCVCLLINSSDIHNHYCYESRENNIIIMKFCFASLYKVKYLKFDS